MRCYPVHGSIDPGDEDDYGPNMEGPGAVTKKQYLKSRMQEILGDSSEDGPIALFDLDGTLADFDGAMVAAMNSLAHPDEPAWTSTMMEAEEPPHITARRRLVKKIPGFWRGLAKLEDGFRVLSLAHIIGYRTIVLSRGPKKNSLAWGEKLDWCLNNLSEDCQVTLTMDKGIVYGRVLVDDWPPYIKAWLEFRKRGLVIMPARPWNIDFKHPQVLRYVLGVNDVNVSNALAARLHGDVEL